MAFSGDRDRELESARQRIAELEREVSSLREGIFHPSGERTVQVPPQLAGPFDSAQDAVARYFKRVIADPSRGRIEINDQRYLLVRASALSSDFLKTVGDLFQELGDREAQAMGRRLLFDIAHTIGMTDARAFHRAMKLTDPIDKLSAGPVHFAYTGWALVEILDQSTPTPDQDFHLCFNHPYSFEADSWIRAGRHATSPVCIMNAGYSSGWCEESFGLPLVAVEISCRAMGQERCSFVMAPPERIEGHLAQMGGSSADAGAEPKPTIPEFFESKRLERELRLARDELEERVRQRTDELSQTNLALTEEVMRRRRLGRELQRVAANNQALASKVMRAQEAERRRVARELHDGIGQVLAALRMDAEWLADQKETTGEAEAVAEDLARRLARTISTVRGIVHDLRPPVLDDLGIGSALEGYALEISRRTPIAVDTAGIGDLELPTELATAIYRIGQEALNNVVRHSGASLAQVSLEQVEGEVLLRVTDNGCGLPSSMVGAASSIGLTGMRERAGLLGGDVRIVSPPEGGTTVIARMPLVPPRMQLVEFVDDGDETLA